MQQMVYCTNVQLNPLRSGAMVTCTLPRSHFSWSYTNFNRPNTGGIEAVRVRLVQVMIMTLLVSTVLTLAAEHLLHC